MSYKCTYCSVAVLYLSLYRYRYLLSAVFLHRRYLLSTWLNPGETKQPIRIFNVARLSTMVPSRTNYLRLTILCYFAQKWLIKIQYKIHRIIWGTVLWQNKNKNRWYVHLNILQKYQAISRVHRYLTRTVPTLTTPTGLIYWRVRTVFSKISK